MSEAAPRRGRPRWSVLLYAFYLLVGGLGAIPFIVHAYAHALDFPDVHHSTVWLGLGMLAAGLLAALVTRHLRKHGFRFSLAGLIALSLYVCIGIFGYTAVVKYYLLYVPRAFQGPVRPFRPAELAHSPDGRYFAWYSDVFPWGPSWRVTTLDTRTMVQSNHEIPVPHQPINDISISPDALLIAAAGNNFEEFDYTGDFIEWLLGAGQGYFRLFDASESRTRISLEGKVIQSIAAANDGRLFALARYNQTGQSQGSPCQEILVYQSTGEMTSRLELPLEPEIQVIRFLPDDHTLLAITSSEAIYWDTRSPSPAAIRPLPGAPERSHVALSGDAGTLAIGSVDLAQIQIWDLHPDNPRIIRTFPGPSAANGGSFKLSRHGRYNTTTPPQASPGESIRGKTVVVDIEKEEEILIFENARAFTFHPVEEDVLVCLFGEDIFFVDLDPSPAPLGLAVGLAVGLTGVLIIRGRRRKLTGTAPAC